MFGILYLLLQEGIERYGHRIYAFCLMTNHVHLAIQVGEERLLGLGKDRMLSRVRGVAAWLVLDSGELTLSELSKWVNRDPSTLSTSARELERQAQTDIQLAQRMSEIKEELYKIQLSKA